MLFFRKRFNKLIDIKKIEEDFKTAEKEPLEKGDLPAMLIAAFLVLTPVLALILGGIYFLMKFIFG